MSLFFQGEDDPYNKINVLSSTIREMLQIVSVNDDAVGFSPLFYFNFDSTAHSLAEQYILFIP